MAPKRLSPQSISGYSVLPIELPPVPSFPTSATHYLYLRPHEPKVPDPDSARSIFIVNVPVSTTETHLRHLFGAQLSAGRVERVEFHGTASEKPSTTTTITSNPKKRKRDTTDELQVELDATALPRTWDRELHTSGAHAIVVFVDRPSMEASLKAAKRAAKTHAKIIWGQGIDNEKDNRFPALGIQRYKSHNRLRYPARAELLRIVNDYMSIFGRFEEARSREAARGAEVLDEDGFVKVTRGPKINDVAREEELRALMEKHKEKSKGLQDFYRFQMREKKKERQTELLKKFEEDKRKLEEMKRRRGKVKDYLILADRQTANRHISTY
ncbi:meiotic recombination protein DMC1 [Histoplasma capsulatum]|uniref:Meiotic recombination protein DMC1 n=1 Tax=Ajellomyces capsulatus TaxID=5037 RepID=A0A8A1M673_AJECA|nr:meiotic recombination protein DMC1 [Histoplasma capsulatum]